jgi:hypothetical protein
MNRAMAVHGVNLCTRSTFLLFIFLTVVSVGQARAQLDAARVSRQKQRRQIPACTTPDGFASHLAGAAWDSASPPGW